MNVAIIGCGAIARKRHAPALSKYEGACFYGVCDPVSENADELAETYHVKAFYDLGTLLSCKEVDAVIICTPERFHMANVIEALRAGKHVLCEKPLALNAGQAEEIVKEWKKTDRMLMVAFSQRTYKVHTMAKQLIREGKIGKPVFFRTNLTQKGVEYTTLAGNQPDFYDKYLKNIGGALLSVGCHRIDLVDYLFDAHIEEVQAFTPTIDKSYADGKKIDAEDHALINAKLSNGLAGLIWISWCNYGEAENETIVYGTNGTLKTFEGKGIRICYKDGSTEEYDTLADHDEYQNITINFLDALTKNKAVIADGLDGCRCMQVIDAVKKSNASGCWVLVDSKAEN
ncbi:Gfo/Idh/MocA family protein [Murimonas intestini]|uniref:Gfo/Idh/MocA family protein n=1 Tax=Murimonas intestini TaxID=1337051 RepID=UPI0011DCAC35|nr:Gfo/Idh/MocA family oxidoreductase [Murimonas intestini]